MENRTSDASASDAASALSVLSEGMADAVERIGPSVVQVHGRRRRAASGVVYAAGRVLTASHVLEREEDLSVVTHDGRTLEARFVGRDPSTDLAVLEVPELGDGVVAELAAGGVRVGQISLAVARPGREGLIRASFGVVSAVGGPLRTGRGARLERYVQTDATPYPGFSGGPLINAEGEVLGITALGLARGVALAVPSEVAWRVAGALEERGSVKRGYLGILSQPVRLPSAQRAGLGDQRVDSSSWASRTAAPRGRVECCSATSSSRWTPRPSRTPMSCRRSSRATGSAASCRSELYAGVSSRPYA